MLWPCFCFVISSQCSTQPDYLNWLSPEPAMAERSAPAFSHIFLVLWRECYSNPWSTQGLANASDVSVPFTSMGTISICHFGLDLAIFLYVPYPFLVVLPVFFSVVKTSKALLCVDHQDPNTAAPIHSILFTRPGPRT